MSRLKLFLQTTLKNGGVGFSPLGVEHGDMVYFILASVPFSEDTWAIQEGMCLRGVGFGNNSLVM